MVNHHSNGDGSASGDERSAGEERGERADFDLHDKPTYLLEHLATFTVNKDSGIVFPADGMRRLLQLEKTTGIWSQKMQLCLDYQWVLIMDYETGNIIERFPASLIQEPTAFTSNDAMELYNNILVFIVSGGGGSRSEMHIFQSQSVSAVHLVEDMKNLRSGKLVMQQRGATPTQLASASGSTISKSISQSHSHSRTSQHHVHQQQHQHQHQHQQQQQQQQQLQQQQTLHHMHQRSSDQYGLRAATADVDIAGITHSSNHGETDSEHGGPNDETSSTSSEKYERDVAVLNHCFDDIEKFIARLQHAAAASRELERRRRNRKSKKRDPGEGLLTLRTRPPHEKEFIDIFAKFKLSFNLLAKLKAHIHDPNAPELVHFLFTPLALIVEASSDTYYESQLPARVINPLLTREAINLLINCVTSKETELWRSLGDAWVIPRDQWKDDVDVGSYHPVFLDGWSPDYLVIDELESPATPTNISKRRLDVTQTQSHGINLGINGRNSAGAHGNSAGAHGSAGIGMGIGIGSGYDDYDTNDISLSDKYTIHHGTDRSERPGAVVASDFNTRSEMSFDSIERGGVGGGGGGGVGGGGGMAPTLNAITAGLQNLQTRESRNANTSYGASNIVGSSGGIASDLDGGNGARGPGGTTTDDQLLESWLEDLQTTGAKVVLVTYPRTANNDKELSVARGEYLEILDDTRKWWKARNIRGQVAHVPHTIVTPYNYGDSENSIQFYGQQQASSKHRPTVSGSNSDNMESRSPDTTDMIRSKHLGKKGEFRYF